MIVPRIKVILCGNSGVGKTSIHRRLVDNSYSDTTKPTIGLDNNLVDLQASATHNPYKLQLWDTSGQERFYNMIADMAKDAQIVVFIYDVTDRASFEALAPNLEHPEEKMHWLSVIPNVKQKLCCVVGNKIDLPRAVPKEEALAFTHHHELLYFEVSARQDATTFIFQALVNHYDGAVPVPKSVEEEEEEDMYEDIVLGKKKWFCCC